MKKFMSFLIIFSLTNSSSCLHAQNNSSEKQIEKMLLGFYSEYFFIWENTPINPTMPINVIHKKLDSLMIKYCTSKLRLEANEHLEFDVDLLTNNLVSVYMNEDLRVEKDSSNENIYIVSFNAYNSDAAGRSVKQEVVLRVSVVKEGERYLINEVK